MYQYTFSSEDTENLTQKTKKYSDLLDGFKDVDKKFSSQDEPFTLEKKTFTKPTDEEISSKAQDSLQDYKTQQLQAIEDDYNTKTTNIDTKIESANSDGDKQKQEANALYSSLKDQAKKDATKRGLARSSIVINILDAFDQNMIEKYNQINDQISSTISSLNNQKSLLSEQRQNALNAFDISYALKLSNKIDEINTELAKEEEKVLQYNNEIAQKEAEYELKRKQNALDYAQYIDKNGQDSIDKAKQDEKYILAKQYLDSLSKQEAMDEILNNKVFSSELGAVNYNKLKVLVNSRKDD